jgi:hypothetical protein
MTEPGAQSRFDPPPEFASAPCEARRRRDGQVEFAFRRSGRAVIQTPREGGMRARMRLALQMLGVPAGGDIRHRDPVARIARAR